MNPSHCDVLIVDDETDILDLVRDILAEEGYRVRAVSDGEEALRQMESRTPTLMLLDIWLGKEHINGLEILDTVKHTHPGLPVIMLSGHGTIETAVSAIKKGAYDFIEKPFNAARLLLLTRRAIEASNLKRENQELRLRLGSVDRVLGVSKAMKQLRQTIEKLAPTNSRVLITGPSGSGKEVCARLIHASSKRSEGPFVALNAAAMAPERMEIELFGIEGDEGEGKDSKIGAFEQADGGTLFLDEVADMPLETQGKILRVLVEQTFERVGGSSHVHVDVRVMSSSSRDIAEEIEAGRLRGDLFHRLNVVPIRLPPLHERREDIPELVEYMAKQFSAVSGTPYRSLAPDAIALLQAHDWPGNIRQLRNNVERIIIMAGGATGTPITASMLPAEVIDSGALLPDKAEGERLMTLPLREARQAFEREYLLAQMNRFDGNISRTASFIGMERSALHRKIKSLGVGG